MAGIVSAALRGSAFIWVLLVTALIGNVIASNVNAATSAVQAINFTIFVAAFAWVSVLVGFAALFMSFLARPLILLPLDGLAVLFTFIDAIVLAGKLGAPNCGNIPNEHHGNHWIAFGSHNDEKRCREIQASTAFMWFLWASLCGCLVFSFMDSRGSGFSMGRSSRSSRPNMSQVGV